MAQVNRVTNPRRPFVVAVSISFIGVASCHPAVQVSGPPPGTKRPSARAAAVPASRGTAVPRFHLPWASGHTLLVDQGNNGGQTHQGLFAWDFPMPIGTPVVAVAAGRVVRVEDSLPNRPAGSAPEASAMQSNVVYIDHGDGLMSVYAHLDQHGVWVRPGQCVVRGQCIARSGDSGYSSGPHLHYEVIGAAGQSVPSGFVEFSGKGGVPEKGDWVTSANTLDPGSLERYTESRLPLQVFTELGVTLRHPSPPAFFLNTDTEYALSGQLRSGLSGAALVIADPKTGTSVHQARAVVRQGGEFNIDFRMPANLNGQFQLGMATGTNRLRGEATVLVWVDSPRPTQAPPVAVVTRPSRSRLAFGDTAELDGAGSRSPAGKDLRYQWMQVSGPPARIENASASRTRFTLEQGPGSARVAFQLVVSDDSGPGIPAEVEWRMKDSFYVAAIGVTDRTCSGSEECAAVSGRQVSAARRFVRVWVDVANVDAGDRVSFDLVDPKGRVTRGKETVLDRPGSGFVAIDWSGPVLNTPGTWQAAVRLNGTVLERKSFRVVP